MRGIDHVRSEEDICRKGAIDPVGDIDESNQVTAYLAAGFMQDDVTLFRPNGTQKDEIADRLRCVLVWLLNTESLGAARVEG